MIYLAADHRGFQFKEELKKCLVEKGYEIEDVGAFSYDKNDDYVDFAIAAAEKIIKDSSVHRGVFICGSGHGMDIMANKYKGVRAAIGFNKAVAVQSREHENANVLVFAADWVSSSEAEEMVIAWLSTEFKGEERHVRRLKKMEEREAKNFK